VLVVVQVINRYFLHFEVMWFMDLALYCATFFMLVSCTVSTARKANVAVDFVRERVTRHRPFAGAVYALGIRAVSIAAVCFFLPAGYRWVVRALRYPEFGSLVPWFNTSWLQISLFVVMLVVLMHLVVHTLSEARHLQRTADASRSR
jgi:TRAP-type C4-dicarboxylate transport system permease small subunit